jgi:uncharacterized protein (TIGR02757 family)
MDRPRLTRNELARRLDRLVLRYGPESLDGDPLSLVRPYENPRDREVAGFLTAALAFGSAKQVIRSAGALLSRLGEHPFETESRDAFRGFRYRWIDGDDLRALHEVLREVIRERGSLEALFLDGLRPGDPDVGPALSRFSRSLMERATRSTRGFRYLLPDPSTGGAAKRLCLLLRWLVRRDDGLDLGVWKGVSPSRLVIPLDTHVLRISRSIGLTARRTASFATAREITASLREFCPEDPVRYDFAIAQLGISKDCRHRREAEHCEKCVLEAVCRL